jgi:MTH538 TIR-like domain (DUF1863)
MARRVFFSFEYDHDVTRAMIVRNSALTHDKEVAGFIDAAEFEEIEDQGDDAVSDWIDDQLERTSVTAVLVGAYTCGSKWVKYEIDKSIQRGNGLLGIDISKIEDFSDNTTERCGKIPEGYKFYLWNKDDGYNNLGTWIEEAALAADK